MSNPNHTSIVRQSKPTAIFRELVAARAQSDEPRAAGLRRCLKAAGYHVVEVRATFGEGDPIATFAELVESCDAYDYRNTIRLMRMLKVLGWSVVPVLPREKGGRP